MMLHWIWTKLLYPQIMVFTMALCGLGVVSSAYASLPSTTDSQAFNKSLSEPIHYDIEVHYNYGVKKLTGTLKVTLPQELSSDSEWWFALPMNRFFQKDNRGIARDTIPPVFAAPANFRKGEEDPLFPHGFNQGYLKVLSVQDQLGKDLDYRVEDNPKVPVGYSTHQGLLKVQRTSAAPQQVVIQFETKLPVRFDEGLIRTELVTLDWHPKLVLDSQNSEELAGFIARPAYYQVTWSSSIPGVLASTSGGVQKVKEGTSVVLPKSPLALKYFPLVFSPKFHIHRQDYPSYHISSVHFEKDKELQLPSLLQEWSHQFFEFVKVQYGLELPWKEMIVVETHSSYEEVRVVNNMIFVPRPHYSRSGFLNRRIFGFLARRLGEVWFGERVWHNTNDQLWLSRGLPGFLGLEFYASNFGGDAGIFNFIDWLNPRYKEHFFEKMFRSMRKDVQQPIITGIYRLKRRDGKKVTVDDVIAQSRYFTYKAAIVVSMLKHTLDSQAFKKGMRTFYQNHTAAMATEKDFRKAMEVQQDTESLEWFFEQWFHTTKELDFAVTKFEVQELSDDRYQTTVGVSQLGDANMPVEVAIWTEDESVHSQKSSGQKLYEELTFVTDAVPDRASIDPNERMVERSRTNNHSFSYVRVRPIFDWKKQREVMITVVPVVGQNALDGIFWGVGTRHEVNEYYRWDITPGYANKSRQFLYLLSLTRERLWTRNFSTTMSLSRVGGVEARGISMDYAIPRRREKLSYGFGSSLQQEQVFDTSDDGSDDELEEEDNEGNTSNFALSHRGSFGIKDVYFVAWNLRAEQPLKDFGAEFVYTRLNASLQNVFKVGFRKQIDIKWIYGSIYGTSPIQKKHQLGGAKVMRGYPNRSILHVLRDDNLLAMRSSYEFPIITTPWWGNISSLGLQGTVFYDRGKVWANDSNFDQVRTRHNVGIGLMWRVDAIALYDFPFGIEMALPLDDPDFHKVKIILSNSLSFF